MTALHRVKAYFGMVPADELDAYDGYDDPRYDDGRYDERYDDRRHDDRRRYESDRPERHEPRHDSRYDDRHDSRYTDRRDDRYEERREPARRADPERHPSERADRLDRAERADRADRADRPRAVPSPSARAAETDEPGGGAPRPRDPRDGRDTETSRSDATPSELPQSRREESEVETSRSSRGRSWATNTGPSHTSVRPTSVSSAGRPAPSLSPVGSSPSGSPGTLGSSGGATRGALAVDASRDSGNTAGGSNDTEAGTAPAEITSLQPTSYNEARVIGERYRDGIPVIMNLTDMDEVAAKRLVDFAAGLAFALRGSIEKVTSRVFLLSPPNVEVSAAERRKLAENSYTAPS